MGLIYHEFQNSSSIDYDAIERNLCVRDEIMKNNLEQCTYKYWKYVMTES